MDKHQISVPSEMVKILVSHFTLTATEHEENMLDEWICEDDDNMQVFEQCLEVANYHPQFTDPFQDGSF